jgi:hypothetical protein
MFWTIFIEALLVIGGVLAISLLVMQIQKR